MDDLERIPAAFVDGAPISLHEVLHQAHRAGRLDLLDHAIDAHLVERAIRRRGIEVTDFEVAELRARFESSAHWRADGMTEAEVRADLRRVVAFGKLRREVATRHVEAYFEEHRFEFERAALCRLTVPTAEGAAAAAAALRAGEPFEAVALAACEDGGELRVGRVCRGDLPPAVAIPLFAAPRGAVVGPVKAEDRFWIARIDRRLPDRLDLETSKVVHDLLFNAWLLAERRSARVDTPLRARLRSRDAASTSGCAG